MKPLRTSSPARIVFLWLVYIVISGATLGANPFSGQTITPFDLLISQPAWSSVDPQAHVRNYQRSDILDAELPAWLNAKRQLHRGHLPFWSEDAAGGSSGLLVLSNGLLTPAFWIFAATPSSPLGFYLAILFELSMAGLGMHLFVRRRLAASAALFAGITFAFCGFNAAWLYWPHVTTLIWCPWLLLAIDRCMERPSMRRSVAIGLATALVLLGSFPFVTVLVLEAGGLYALILWLPRLTSRESGHWAFISWYAAGCWLGILLCAIPLIAFMGWLDGFNIGYRSGGSFLNWRDWNLLFPWRAWATPGVESTMYVGATCVALAIAALLGWIFLRRRWLRPLPVFGTSLFIIAAGFVFNLWPMWLVGWLPGMSFNPWSRAISILDVALIILGACALDGLWNLGLARWTRLLRVAAVGLLLAQAYEITEFFRQYNGPVPSAFYYPETPAIRYMQTHIGPFDYVVADKSFLISGTLGAYGLREWFAHAFRTTALKNALKSMATHAFSSATSSRLDSTDLRLRSRTYDVFNVRYLAVNKNAPLFSRAPTVQQHAGAVALPPLPKHKWRQEFVLHDNVLLSGISVRLATYRRTGLPGTVSLTLKPVNGTVLATASTRAANVVDNAMHEFVFDQPVSLRPGRYTFALAYDAQQTNMSVTAWAWSSPSEGRLFVDGHGELKTVEYLLDTEPSGNASWKKVFSGNQVTIWKNSNSPDGPYFLQRLHDIPNARSSSHVEVLHYEPASFTLKYTGSVHGYVVVPMTWTPNWQVEVTGQTVLPTLVDGVLPAIPVNGPAKLTFSYHPQALRWTWVWLVLLALTAGSMVFAERRWHRP